MHASGTSHGTAPWFLLLPRGAALLPWFVLGTLVVLSVDSIESVGQSFDRVASPAYALTSPPPNTGRPANASPRAIEVQLTVHDRATGAYTHVPCLTTSDRASRAASVVDSEDLRTISGSLCSGSEELVAEYGPGVGGTDSVQHCLPADDQADIQFYLLAAGADRQQLRAIEAAVCQAP
jgi:hypothetical protein